MSRSRSRDPADRGRAAGEDSDRFSPPRGGPGAHDAPSRSGGPIPSLLSARPPAPPHGDGAYGIPSLLHPSRAEASRSTRVNWVPRRDRDDYRDDGRADYREDRRRSERDWRRHDEPATGVEPRARFMDDDILHCPKFEEWQTSAEGYADPSPRAFSRFVKEWDDRRVQFFADRHWKEEWFLLRYDATLAAEVAQARHSALLHRAQSLTLDAPNPVPSNEPDRVLMTAVPPMVPMTATEQALKTAGEAVAVFFSDVNKSALRLDMGRSCIIVYPDAESARRALRGEYVVVSFVADPDGVTRPKISDAEVTLESARLYLKAFRAPPRKTLSPEMCTAERLAHDLVQAQEIAKLLDAAEDLAVNNSGLDAFHERAGLGESASTEAKLHATVFYLGRVHAYDYYSGVKSADEGEFMHERPFVLVRGGGEGTGDASLPPASEVKPDTVDASFERMRARYSAEAVSRRREDEEQARKKMADAKQVVLTNFVKEVTVKEDEEKYRCTLPPRKLFKAPHFVEKHVVNMQKHLLRIEERKHTHALLMERYFVDPDKPFPRLHPSVQMILDQLYPGAAAGPASSVSLSDAPSHSGETEDVAAAAAAAKALVAPLLPPRSLGDPRAAPPPLQTARGRPPPVSSYRPDDAYQQRKRPRADERPDAPPKLQYRTRVSYADVI